MYQYILRTVVIFTHSLFTNATFYKVMCNLFTLYNCGTSLSVTEQFTRERYYGALMVAVYYYYYDYYYYDYYYYY
jgi:hypothetical protein